MQSMQQAWTWRGRTVEIGCDTSGQGPTILLLPAPSSISTRREMRPLQSSLSRNFRTVAIDWPGFGDRPRPPCDWTPETYAAFLAFVLERIAPSPYAVVAAGHAATYALVQACAHPQSMGRLVLVAPTWRGPLPTMMNGRRPLFVRLARMIDVPLVGPLLYALNVNRLVIRLMANGHVYAERRWLNAERMRDKLAVTRAAGARFASVRFVTGLLDSVATRGEFLELARRTRVPVLLVYGSETPRRSLAEMEALAAVPGVRSVRLSRGKLGVHEEFPVATVEAIKPFLGEEPSASA